MSVEKPKLWVVLGDTSRIIRSNSVHFLALSLLFIFPISLLSIILTSTLQPSSSHSHHRRRLLSTFSNQENSPSGVPPLDKSQILSQFVYGLLIILFNLFSVSSITHSIFHGFHRKPIKLSSSLKSILSSFFPLLATWMAYFIIIVVISFALGICVAFVFLGLIFMGFEIDPTSISFMAVVFVTMIPLLGVWVYLGVKWFLMDAIVVVENKYGFAPFQRSMDLTKGARGVGLLMMLLFALLNLILSGLMYSPLGGVALQMVAYVGFSTVLSLFSLGAKTVLFIYCKAFNGELELPSFDKPVYVQLSHDVVDEV